MKIRNLLTGMALLAGVTVIQSPAQADVTVGNNTGANCYPFSCLASDTNGSEYQEVYSAAAFAGPTSINAISFFQSIAGPIDSATYTVSFYTTSAPVGGLSTTGASNLGTLLSNFGTFTLNGSLPPVLTLNGSAFNYDPGLGNLLLDVTISNLTVAHPYESFFQADYNGAQVSRYWAYNGSLTGSVGNGALVTQFSTANVPEPAAWAMMLTGFGLAGVALRRRRVTFAR